MHVNKVNNKKYIGITKTSVNKRWGCNGSGYRNNKQSVFYRAIQKYGWDNFEHIILYENLSQDEACNMEIKLIKEYKTQDSNFGYNVQSGGQLGNDGVVFSEESKKKMSEAHIDKKHSVEHNRKISESMKKADIKKPKTKYKWLTPTGEIKIMDKSKAKRWHPDWTIIGEA